MPDHDSDRKPPERFDSSKPATDDTPTRVARSPWELDERLDTGSDHSRRAGQPADAGASAPSEGKNGADGKSGTPVLSDHQPTVISKNLPVNLPAVNGPAVNGRLSQLELGRVLQGERLGHFQLEEFVGGGGMGAVFRATDTMLGRTVAVKVLSRDSSADSETVRRFKNEGQSAARLDHGNIARVYYVGEDNGWHYIVFEFIEGINIRDLVEREGPLSLDDAVSFTRQVAAALTHAAQRDVVHRDIKPSNVLITPDGKAKLVDMGLARLHQVESSSNDLTASGVTLGTFDYISPEQARDPRLADVRSDLYSLGCTFYYMLTGRPPFPEGTVLQKLLSHSTDAVPDPRKLRPDLPPEITTIVSKLLAKQREQRHQDPSELIGDLMELEDRLGLKSAGEGGIVWRTAPRGRWEGVLRQLPWLLPTSLLILLVVGLEFLWRPLATTDLEPQFRLAPVARTTPAPEVVPTPPIVDAPAPVSPPAVPETADPSAPPVTPTPAPPEPAATVAPSNAEEVATAGDLPPRTEPPVTAEPLAEPVATPGAGPAATGGEAGVGAAPTASAAVQSAPAESAGIGPAAVDSPVGDVVASVDAPQPAVLEPPRVILIGNADMLPKPEPDQRVVESLETLLRDQNQWRTLAETVEVIELCYNGLQRSPPLQLAVPKPRLTLRAGEGFAPIVRFEPTIGSVSQHPRNMMQLSGGDLAIEGIHFEMIVPREPSNDPWSLFQLQQLSMLQLSRCSLTIRNAGEGRNSLHEDVVAFLDVVPSPKEEMMLNDMPAAMQTIIPITIEDTVARGEATFLRASEVLPLRLEWRNGLLITTERLLSVGGSQRKSVEYSYVRLILDRLTAITDRGLCLLSNSNVSAPHQAMLSMNCTNSIFISARTEGLIDQRGLSSVERFQEQVSLEGRNNFYQDIEHFRRIDADRADGAVITMGWDDWQNSPGNKEDLSNVGGVQWLQAPAATLPVSRQTLAMYRLNPHPSNNAYDLRAGFDDANLPPFPPAVATSPDADMPPGTMPNAASAP